jgi:hypothetical protein
VASTLTRGGTLDRKLCAFCARRGARSRIRSSASWLSATVASRHGLASRTEVAFAARNKRLNCRRHRSPRPVATDSRQSHVVSRWAASAHVRGSQISQQFLPNSVIFYADSEPGGGLEDRGLAGAHLVFCGFGVATLVGRVPWLTGPPATVGEETGWAERSSSARG